MPCRLEFKQWVSFPLDHVFAFFCNPENLPRLMPAEMETRIDQLQILPPPALPPLDAAASKRVAGVGTVIVTSFRMFPFLSARAQWIARITEFEWNHHFADVQQKGPFKSWHHRHEFRSESRDGVDGTLVRDLIEYEVGFGLLGSLANLLFVERQMRGTFAARQKSLPQLLA
jgi:ligand-binding SRPBCC domain-containing protein